MNSTMCKHIVNTELCHAQINLSSQKNLSRNGMKQHIEDTSLHSILTDFLHKIESLHESVPMLMAILYVHQKMTRAKKSKFLSKYGEVVEENEEFKKYKLSIEFNRAASRLDKKHQRAVTASNLLLDKILISYVSEYDAFLGRLIKKILELKPELLNSGEKNVSFAMLKQLGSVEAAFQHIIEKEVESVLRNSHADHFKWLEKLCNVTLTKNLESWGKFIELTERRNLFVHCDGVVSTQYLTNCQTHQCQVTSEISVGTRLNADKNYLNSSFECLYEIAVKLTQVIWRKLFPTECDQADDSLINVSYSLIHEEKYKVAQELLDFGVDTIKNHASDSNKRILIINRAQAYYHDKNKEKSNKIINSVDWSSCADQFQLCVAVLKEDYDKATLIMKRMGKDGSIQEADYLDWPVFREFRKDQKFSDTFHSVFGKPPSNTAEFIKTIDTNQALSEIRKELELELETKL